MRNTFTLILYSFFLLWFIPQVHAQSSICAYCSGTGEQVEYELKYDIEYTKEMPWMPPGQQSLTVKKGRMRHIRHSNTCGNCNGAGFTFKEVEQPVQLTSPTVPDFPYGFDWNKEIYKVDENNGIYTLRKPNDPLTYLGIKHGDGSNHLLTKVLGHSKGFKSVSVAHLHDNKHNYLNSKNKVHFILDIPGKNGYNLYNVDLLGLYGYEPLIPTTKYCKKIEIRDQKYVYAYIDNKIEIYAYIKNERTGKMVFEKLVPAIEADDIQLKERSNTTINHEDYYLTISSKEKTFNALASVTGGIIYLGEEGDISMSNISVIPDRGYEIKVNENKYVFVTMDGTFTSSIFNHRIAEVFKETDAFTLELRGDPVYFIPFQNGDLKGLKDPKTKRAMIPAEYTSMFQTNGYVFASRNNQTTVFEYEYKEDAYIKRGQLKGRVEDVYTASRDDLVNNQVFISHDMSTQKYGVLRITNEEVVPFAYDAIEKRKTFGVLFLQQNKEGKTLEGLYFIQPNQLISAQYAKIHESGSYLQGLRVSTENGSEVYIKDQLDVATGEYLKEGESYFDDKTNIYKKKYTGKTIAVSPMGVYFFDMNTKQTELLYAFILSEVEKTRSLKKIRTQEHLDGTISQKYSFEVKLRNQDWQEVYFYWHIRDPKAYGTDLNLAKDTSYVNVFKKIKPIKNDCGDIVQDIKTQKYGLLKSGTLLVPCYFAEYALTEDSVHFATPFKVSIPINEKPTNIRQMKPRISYNDFIDYHHLIERVSEDMDVIDVNKKVGEGKWQKVEGDDVVTAGHDTPHRVYKDLSKNKYGVKDQHGNFLVKPKYAFISPFYGEYAWVKKKLDKPPFFIDKYGEKQELDEAIYINEKTRINHYGRNEGGGYPQTLPNWYVVTGYGYNGKKILDKNLKFKYQLGEGRAIYLQDGSMILNIKGKGWKYMDEDFNPLELTDAQGKNILSRINKIKYVDTFQEINPKKDKPVYHDIISKEDYDGNVIKYDVTTGKVVRYTSWEKSNYNKGKFNLISGWHGYDMLVEK
jgi:hypothetical protein